MSTEKQAVLIKTCDAVAAEALAAREEGAFDGLLFEPVRSYADWKDDDLGDITDLRVDVVPVDIDVAEKDDRGSTHYVVVLDVGVRKKFEVDEETQCGKVDRAEIDRLVLFIEELHERFCKVENLPTFEDAVWRSSTIRAAFSRKHLREMRMFLGVIRLSYDVSIEL